MNSRTFVKLGARQCLRSLGGQLRMEKLGVSSTPRLPLLWGQTRRTPFGLVSEGRVFTRNIAAACSSTDGKGGEAEGEKGIRGKGQAQR